MAPVAAYSRRTRRQPSEDISEGPATQRNKVEDVEMDSGDEAARHRSSRKRGKKKATAAADGDEIMIDADLDAVDVPDQPFDKEALLNQPLSQKQLAKLQSFATDTTATLDVYKPDAMEMTKRLAGHIAEFMRNNQDKVGWPAQVLLGFESIHLLGSWGTGYNDEDADGCRAMLPRSEGLCLVVARETEKRRETRMWYLFEVLSITGLVLTISIGRRGHPVRRGCEGKERRVQVQDESTEVPQK